MAVKYKRFVRAKISTKKFQQILRAFALDLTATQIAVLTNLNRDTVNRYLTFIRQAIALFCERESPFSGVIELDESYFGTKRAKGKRGRGTSDKTIVFGIYKRNGRVYTEIVPDVTKDTLLQIVKGKVGLDSIIHTDGFRSYDGIVHLGYQKHYRILHADGQFAIGSNHINGIEGFWGYAKVRLAKFRGLSKDSFYFHLKECEFRFNYRQENLYSLLLKISKDNGLI